MIVGTAGHIDHGKTALLQALTGQAGDQRQEERARGMTIDLGYRYAALTEGAALTGFIDVPGHERFIHNMLAGAHGIDLVLLVVAADDGVMPQTREHLAIIELLGIPQALVAISKCDRVEPARLAEVQAQVSELLAPGPYAGARQFPLSSVTGEGIDALRQALLAAQQRVCQRSVRGGFRLAVDRAFAVTGAGVVVTGTALAGRVSAGDTLLLGKAGKPVRVRGLHAQNQAAERAIAGQRVALNLSAERLALEQDLLSDAKELAEHLMLIDLGRNDVGRVAQTGTVRLTEKMVIERYSNVMHIVSNVTGQLKAPLTAIDALRAILPAGTLSGAPKIRAMEIIDELEPVKRGVYGGAVGYLAWNGNMDTAIAIRTAVIKDGELHVQAGAGIVADSVPALEWEETLNKRRAMFRAVALAEQTVPDQSKR